VERADIDAKGLQLKALPTDLVGARALTDIAAGQVLHRSMVVPAPLVRTGDEVALTLRSGPIVVEGRGIAAQTGRLGDVIHVVSPETKRRIAARVTGRGLAEVQHGR
jgi:flagella basal body P-ring formation protein FlgA